MGYLHRMGQEWVGRGLLSQYELSVTSLYPLHPFRCITLKSKCNVHPPTRAMSLMGGHGLFPVYLNQHNRQFLNTVERIGSGGTCPMVIGLQDDDLPLTKHNEDATGTISLSLCDDYLNLGHFSLFCFSVGSVFFYPGSEIRICLTLTFHKSISEIVEIYPKNACVFFLSFSYLILVVLGGR